MDPQTAVQICAGLSRHTIRLRAALVAARGRFRFHARAMAQMSRRQQETRRGFASSKTPIGSVSIHWSEDQRPKPFRALLRLAILAWPEWCSRRSIRSCDDRDEGSTPSSGPFDILGFLGCEVNHPSQVFDSSSGFSQFSERSTVADAAGCRPVSNAGSNPAAPTRRAVSISSPGRSGIGLSLETGIRCGWCVSRASSLLS